MSGSYATPGTVRVPPTPPVLDSVFGRLWPDPRTPGRPRLLAAALAVALLAAVIVPFRAHGLAAFLSLLAVSGVVVTAGRGRFSAARVGSGILCLLLMSAVMIRDAGWIVALCLLAAFAVGSAALTDGRSLNGLIASMASVPMATLRGLPWLGRALSTGGRPAAWWPAVRTIVLSAALVLVFGMLFASADALFAQWVDVVVPNLTFTSLFIRGFVFAAVLGLTLAGAFVAVVPPHVDRLSLPAARSVRRYEWAVPVGLVLATFAVFLTAQLSVLFGGHDYLQHTTGLTYAEYVHEGFGQLTVATALTLVVVAAAARREPRRTASDRALVRVLLGLLCACTLVVVASALYRMHVYEEAYGFTRLRLLVSVFETWLGVVVVLVLAAGVGLRGRWVPLASLLSGAVMMLGLAALNPDGFIAERNIERFEKTGKVDMYYLSSLSADAVPALAEVGAVDLACALDGRMSERDDWLAWNLGRARAYDALESRTGSGAAEEFLVSPCG